MTDSNNVVPMQLRRRPNMVSTLTAYDPHGWLEITPTIYDWFFRNPSPSTHVHEYGFLHDDTRRAFVCVAGVDGGPAVCGMSNSALSVDDFYDLRADDVIDAVIERLGYDPTTA